MPIRIKKILFLVFQVFMIINICCSRNDPEVVNNNPNVQSLNPIAVYNLDIPEPSGLAFNSQNNSLMVVSDARSDIYEIGFDGIIKGTISTTSSDLEGISLSKNSDTIYVVEETNKLVVTYLATGVRLSSFLVNVATNPKYALEGIAWNNINRQLVVLNEKLPCMILKFANSTEIWRKEINYTTDISDIFYEEQSDYFWIVSDESQKILKLSKDLNLISEWSIPVLQGEGITIVQDRIYIVSDVESKMYVFQKPI
jgi:uncharacterized protein YjiK